MLQGPYKRRRPRWRDRIRRLGITGWLWIVVVVAAGLLIAIRA
jgi:hypothetical protein